MGASGPMRFGLSACGAGFESAPLEELGDWAAFAEELGFTGLWINEEHFQRHGHDRRTCLSPIILATALAARTRRIRLGFSVLLLALHHPLRLAEEVATLDVLSSGRVDFGISRGNSSRYLTGYGIQADELTDRFRETLGLVLKCWAGQPVITSEGPQSVEPRPIQTPHPPVYIGGYIPRSTLVATAKNPSAGRARAAITSSSTASSRWTRSAKTCACSPKRAAMSARYQSVDSSTSAKQMSPPAPKPGPSCAG
jgi:alkanesulfonate monooxygenase SsuD/methylene tetrahydromethanopterin reductase-like flavin-dependent oxidoreductase (luciferase family)